MPYNSALAADAVLDHSVALLERIFPSPRNFAVRLWDEYELPADTSPVFTIVLNHPGALRRMYSPPLKLALGEAYIDNDFDIEGDFDAVFEVIHSPKRLDLSTENVAVLIKDVQSLPDSGPVRWVTRQPAQLSGERHSRDRDRKAIRFHYDVGNDFYALWLDRQMQYSCGFFPTSQENLDTAQAQKIEHISANCD